LAEEAMYISIVTYMEVYQGSLRAEDPDRALANLRALVDDLPILPFSEDVAE
jgi:predicted nucleic acid-binding protein